MTLAPSSLGQASFPCEHLSMAFIPTTLHPISTQVRNDRILAIIIIYRLVQCHDIFIVKDPSIVSETVYCSLKLLVLARRRSILRR
jgi:hypothetical protein